MLVLSPAMAALAAIGSLGALGCAHWTWFSLRQWLRSHFLVLSNGLAALRERGSLSNPGCAQILWFSLSQWLARPFDHVDMTELGYRVWERWRFAEVLSIPEIVQM